MSAWSPMEKWLYKDTGGRDFYRLDVVYPNYSSNPSEVAFANFKIVPFTGELIFKLRVSSSSAHESRREIRKTTSYRRSIDCPHVNRIFFRSGISLAHRLLRHTLDMSKVSERANRLIPNKTPRSWMQRLQGMEADNHS